MVSITSQRPREVSLNNAYFRIRGPVEQFIASSFPQKIIQGDFGLETHPLVSAVVWRDHRPGIGKDIYDPAESERTWWSTCSLRHRGHLVLPRRTVQTTAASSVGAVGFINDLQTSVFASFGTAVHAYNNATDSWGSSVRTLAAAATDSMRCMLNGSDTLAVATTTEVDYTTDGTTWNRNTTDILYLEFWHELLWGIDTAGQLYWTNNLANAWTADAVLRLPSGSVTDLVVGPSPDPDTNRTLLYAPTIYGLYVYDPENSRFVETDLQVPPHASNGKGTRTWRGALYFPAGNAIYKYQPGPQTVVSVMGPDLDDGLPSDRRGSITTMAATHNDLIVGIDSTTGTTTTLNTFITSGADVHHSVVFALNSGYPTVLGWSGGAAPEGQGGWEVKWGNGTQGDSIQALFVSRMYSSYRLWWGAAGRVYYQALPTDIVNPSQVTTTQYESSGTWDSPWFAPDANEQKTALEARLETRNPTASETVALAYATNYVESFTNLGTQTSAGETAYPFPTSASPTGTAFRAIRLRVTLARGSTNTNSPDVTRLTLLYLKPYAQLLGFRMTLDLTQQGVHGATIKEQRANLDTILAATTLLQFTYRDESNTDRVYYVIPQPQASTGQDRCVGRDESGFYVLTVVEAR